MEIKHKVPFIFKVRNATPDDVDRILQLDNEVWTDFPASRDMIASRVKIFPEGNFIAIRQGEIIGYLALQFVNYDLEAHPSFTWNKITNNGTIASTHNITGEYMYGVGMTVSPRYQNLGIAARLIFAGWGIVVKYNKKGCLIGSRIPGYSKASKICTPEQYLELRREDGKLEDPELRLYEGDGFKVICLLPDYENDPPSCNYGALVYRNNPLYGRGGAFFHKFMALILARWGHKILWG